MKIRHGYFKDAEIIEMKTAFIQIMGEGDRVLFEISLLDDHTIEVGAGDVSKDGAVLYDDKLVLLPKFCNSIEITKPLYK